MRPGGTTGGLLLLLAAATLLPLGAPSALADWLEEEALEAYAAQFADAGVSTLADLARVDEAQLKAFGLKLKERKRVVKSLKALGASAEQESSPGAALDATASAALGAALQEAQALHREEKPLEAAAAMLKATELDPTNPNWRMNLGSMYELGGDREGAMSAYSGALNLGAADSEQLAARVLPRLSQLLRKSGQAEQAVRLFDDLLAKHPTLAADNPAVALEHSNVLKATGDADAAKKAAAFAKTVEQVEGWGEVSYLKQH